jgi:uncharacterized protein
MRSRESCSLGIVAALHRYPVKSMLGESQETLTVRKRGAIGDRAWAVLDEATGKIVSAKRPKLWRDLLRCTARITAGNEPGEPGPVEITLPHRTECEAGDPDLDCALSALTGRTVRLINTPPEIAEIDRAHPEVALTEGLGADVDYSILALGGGAPPGTFLDYAALHLLTTATLEAITVAVSDGSIEPVRYRPNVIIRSPPATSGFTENDWVNSIVRIGEEVVLSVILQTPRCSIPMLAHGALPARTAALRVLAERNRIDVPGFGDQPCAGVYAAVLQEGTIRIGDRVVGVPG